MECRKYLNWLARKAASLVQETSRVVVVVLLKMRDGRELLGVIRQGLDYRHLAQSTLLLFILR